MEFAEKPSKSAKKREMHALQAMGEALVALPAAALSRIELPEQLAEAIREARRLRTHEARRRQLQYIGRLMRTVDGEKIREALAEARGASAQDLARQHRIERWRERLLADEKTLDAIAAQFPAADFTRLRQLRRNALKEKAEGKPLRAYRQLYQLLKEVIDVGT